MEEGMMRRFEHSIVVGGERMHEMGRNANFDPFPTGRARLKLSKRRLPREGGRKKSIEKRIHQMKGSGGQRKAV
jgi:hypothetical protein